MIEVHAFRLASKNRGEQYRGEEVSSSPFFIAHQFAVQVRNDWGEAGKIYNVCFVKVQCHNEK